MAGRADQGVRDAELPTKASGARANPPAAASGIAGLIQRVLALRVARVFLDYSSRNGPLLATGMSNQAVFALFAGLWFAFSIAGFIINNNAQLRNAVFAALNGVVPGLIGFTEGQGVIQASTLLNASALSVSGVISLVGVLFTAVGFLGTLRTAIRLMFGLPGPTTNFAILKLKDTGLAIAFGAVILLTAVISVVTSTATTGLLGLLGVSATSTFAMIVASGIGAILIFVIDSVTLAGAMRILSGIRVPGSRLRAGAVLGGAGLAILQTVGSSLLGVSKSNPLLATFAVILGLFVYFNLICQVILIAASWVAVGMRDAHIDPRSLSVEQLEVEKARELEDARRLVADANRRALQQRVRAARGARRWQLARELKREVRDEARRRKAVPTAVELEARIAARQTAASGGDPADDGADGVSVGPR